MPDDILERMEKVRSPEALRERLQLFEYRTSILSPEQVKRKWFFYFDRSDEAPVWKLNGEILKIEPLGDEPRYIFDQEAKELIPQIPGAFGVLPKSEAYVLKDKKNDRLVVAKASDFSRNTILEARRLAKFQHPNVVSVLDLAITNPEDIQYRTVYIVMEYLEGGDLMSWFKSERSLEEIVRVLNHVAAGVSHINQQNFIYADIKPENVVFDSLGNAKICDVEVSVEIGENGTAEPHVFHSYHFAAPEQIKQNQISLQTDVFSFGAFVFALLQDEISWSTSHDRRDFCKSGELVPMKSDFEQKFKEKPELHARLSEILRKALSTEPEYRQSNVEDLNRELMEVFLEIENL